MGSSATSSKATKASSLISSEKPKPCSVGSSEPAKVKKSIEASVVSSDDEVKPSESVSKVGNRYLFDLYVTHLECLNKH